MVHGGRRHVADATMVMALVVPREELLTVGTSIFDTTETLREIRTVFEGFEMRLGEGLVIGNIRPTVEFWHSHPTIYLRYNIRLGGCSSVG